jgi:hypothetical protein
MPHRVQIDGIDYAPAPIAAIGEGHRYHSPLPSREGAALWSKATSLEGYRMCRYCGQFVRDDGDLESHCCLGHDDD